MLMAKEPTHVLEFDDESDDRRDNFLHFSLSKDAVSCGQVVAGCFNKLPGRLSEAL